MLSAPVALTLASISQNFYSLTVYEKGAEIVRIYDTLLGQDGFRRGMVGPVAFAILQMSGSRMTQYRLWGVVMVSAS